MKTKIVYFGCKNCGAPLAMKDGQRVIICDYCGIKNLVFIENYAQRYRLPPQISLQEAKRLTVKFLKDKELAQDLSTNARFYSAGLYYLPVYEMTAVRAGKIIQRDIQRINDGFGGERIKETFRANVLMSDIYWNAPAAKLIEWGIENIHLEKIRREKAIEPFDPSQLEKGSHFFDVDVSPETLNTSHGFFEGYLAGDQSKLTQKSIKLAYTPVWLIKYTYHGRLYKIVIEAVTGKILFARAPATDKDRVSLMLAIIFLITYPIARAIRFLAFGDFSPLGIQNLYFFSIPFLILLCILLLAFAVAWNQFRYSSEVVISGETRHTEMLNKPPETKIEKLARSVADLLTSGIDSAYKKTNRRWYSTF